MSKVAIYTGIQNLAYIEKFYADFQRDPGSVPAEWREFFSATVNGDGGSSRVGPSFKSRSIFDPAETNGAEQRTSQPDPQVSSLSDRLQQLVHNYRGRGHLLAAVNPLGMTPPRLPELELDFYGFSESELSLLINTPTLHYDTPLTVREIFQRLRDTYCRSIGDEVVRTRAPVLGARGGGKADLAQGAGGDSAKLPEAFATVRALLAGS